MGKRHRSNRQAETSGPLGIRRTRDVGVEDVAAALTAAEYASVRDESLQSFATSQSIIQWSLATYGVLFAAGLLAAGDQIAPDFAPSVLWMAALIYGLLLPGLVCAAAWSWIGEIKRTERVGVYLRGVERRVNAETQRSSSSVVGPLNWETFLTGSSQSTAPPVKGWAPYLGTAMLFGGGIISSVVFFYFWVNRIFETDGPTFGLWLLIGADAAVVLLFFGVCVHAGLGVVVMGNQFYDFETRSLLWIRKPRRYRLVEVVAFVLIGVAGVLACLWLLPDSVLAWRNSALHWTGMFGE